MGKLEDLNQAIQLVPDDASLYAKRSLYHAANNDAEKAINDGEKAVTLDPRYWFTYYARGRAYQLDDQFYFGEPGLSEAGNSAIQDLTQVINMHPQFGEAYGYRAQVYIRQEKLEYAFEDLKKALEYDPSSWVVSMQSVVNSLADDGYSVIEMLPIVIGMPGYNELVKGAVTDWDHYLQWRLKRKSQTDTNFDISPDDHDQITVPAFLSAMLVREIDAERSIHYQELGLKFKREGNYQASQEAYQKAIELDYTDALAYYALAKTCYLAGKARDAIRNYLCTLHLSLANLIIAYNNSEEQNPIKAHRQMLEAQLTPGEMQVLRQTHPYVDLLLLDPNTPRHLGHAIVDLNKGIDKSGKLKRHIEDYTKGLEGKNTRLNDEIEDTHYLVIGRTFAFNNIRWHLIDICDPYTLYTKTDKLVADGMKELFEQLP